MTKGQWKLVGAATFVVIAVAVGLTIGLSSGGGSSPQVTHVAYARLWTKTILGTSRETVLGTWPKPYQTYPDGFKNQCFEWWDRPFSLYNLCFKKGVLVTKSIA